MFSPAKAATVGALAFAIGGVMLVAQPFRQASVTTPGADTGTNALMLEDGTDDFRAQPSYVEELEWVETRGPADADLVNVTVSVDGDRLVVRFETAEAVPQVPEGYDPVVYKLLVDTDGDPQPEYETWSEYGESGWVSQLTDLVGETDDRLEAPEVVDGTVTVSLGLDALPVAPSEMRFAAMTQVWGGFDDSYNAFNWIPTDRVPDDEHAWRTLDEADAVGATAVASPR